MRRARNRQEIRFAKREHRSTFPTKRNAPFCRTTVGVDACYTRAVTATLNPAQTNAVQHAHGPLLVLAGAGTGKTRVITHRIARLVNDLHVAPDSILAVSFTNKSASEMAERMTPLVGKDRARRLWLSTFHSFGMRFLSDEAKTILGGGHNRFVIFDQGDAVGLLREIARREGVLDRKLDLWSVLGRISAWKNKMLTPSDVDEGKARIKDVEYDLVAKDLYPHYQNALRSMRAYDFDDLVLVPTLALRDREDLREKWSTRFRFLLVDEFQDTNLVQLELVKLLGLANRNVCVVGDDDQSIYGWRGAEAANILDFEKTFSGATVVKLEENYRSFRPILEVANAAISRATGKRHDKVLRATRQGGDKVKLSVLGTQEQEARFVAEEIRGLRKEGRLYSDVAVLYRSNQQAALIEEELRVHGVPYRLFGGTKFFERKEVKDAVAYLRCVVNPNDELSFRRILNYPARGVGDTTVARIERRALAKGLSFAQVALRLDTVEGAGEQAAAATRRLGESLARARDNFEGGKNLAAHALGLLDEVGLRAALQSGDTELDKQRWASIEFVLRSLSRYEEKEQDQKPSLTTFLQRITMQFDDEEDTQENCVTLSTLHSAKGLEWNVVFLIGVNEGTLPHGRILDPKITEATPTDVEEERRLFYVGVTRARERLFISRCLRKEMRGKEIPLTPSRFLEGLPEEYVEHYSRDDAQPLSAEQTESNVTAFLAQLRGGP